MKKKMWDIVKDAFNHCNKGKRFMDKETFRHMSAYIVRWHHVWNIFKDTDHDKNFRIDLNEWNKSELSKLFGSEYGTTDNDKFKAIDKNNSGALTADKIMQEINRQEKEGLEYSQKYVQIHQDTDK